MSKTKRPLIIAILTVAFLCAVSVLGGGYALAFADVGTPAAVEISADASNWTQVNGFAFNDTLGMHLTAGHGVYAATQPKSIGGNSTVVFEIDANVTDRDWNHDWIVFKNTNDEEYTAFDSSNKVGPGNWIAIYFGNGTNFMIAECVEGTVYVEQCGLHCAAAWDSSMIKQTITITTTDTENGVDVSMKYESPTEKTTATYSSKNKLLWGAYGISLGRKGGGTVNVAADSAKTYKYKISVTDVASDKEPIANLPQKESDNYAQNLSNWNTSAAVGDMNYISVDKYGYGLTFAQRNASLTYGLGLEKQVQVNSAVSMKVTGDGNSAEWGQFFVVFKNKSETVDADAAMHDEPTGTWMALRFGNGYGAKLLECVNGTVSETDISSSVPNSETNYWASQTSDITIKTVDNKNGTVDVTVTFKASNNNIESHTITGETYTVNYTTKDTTGAFSGDYAFSLGAYYPGNVAFRLNSLKSDKELTVNDGLCNFATDIKYWKGGNNVPCFEFDSNGMSLWDTDRAEMMLNQKVESNQTLSLAIDGTLNEAGWGNYYFIMNFDEPGTALNGNLPVPKGKRLAIVIGGDGFLYIHSIDGQWTNGVTLDGSKSLKEQMEAGSFDGNVELNDYKDIFKDLFKLSFAIDSDENGVDIVVTIHTPSGKTGVAHLVTEYTAEDVANGYWFNIGYFLGANCGDGGNITVSSLKINGVSEGYVAPFNTKEEIDAMQLAVSTASTTAVTEENFEELKAKYEEFAAFELSLNYEQLKKWVPDLLATLKANLEAYPVDKADAQDLLALIAAIPETITAAAENAVAAAEEFYEAMSAAAKAMVDETAIAKMTAARAALTALEDRAAADAVLALIAAIPTEITAANKTEAETKVAAAETAYAALGAGAKAMVGDSEAAKITAARAAINALNDSDPDKEPENPPSESPDDGGCGSGVAASGAVFALALLGICAAVLAVSKRKTVK